MRPALRVHAARQNGLVTRRQAVEAGYRERELRTLTAVGGAWVVVRRGVYVEREVWEVAATTYDAQDRLRDLAAHLCMTAPHLMSHDSAARAWGLPMLRPQQLLSHITREGVGGSRTEHGVKHHLTRLGLLNTATVNAVPVTGLARTAVDVGREHGWLAGTVVVDAVLRRGVPLQDLEAELAVMRYWPGVTEARAAVELGDEGADRPGESVTRVLLEGLGLGRPRTQFPIRTRLGVAWVDMLLGCHVVEFDGRVKFRRVEDGGVADRPIEDVLWDERTRQNAVCEEGFGMSRVVWDDLWGARQGAMLDRVLSEYAVTTQRFGAVLPERHERFAEQLAAERIRRIRRGSSPAA